MTNPIVTNRPKNGIMPQECFESCSAIELLDLFGCQDLVFLDDLNKMRHAITDAARVVALLEARREVVADQLTGKSIRQHAFEAIADFDFHLAIVRRDQDQHAIVFLRLSDAPLLEQAIGILVDRHAVQRFDGRDGDLGRCLLFQLIEHAINRGLGGGVDHIGEIVNAAGRLGE